MDLAVKNIRRLRQIIIRKYFENIFVLFNFQWLRHCCVLYCEYTQNSRVEISNEWTNEKISNINLIMQFSNHGTNLGFVINSAQGSHWTAILRAVSDEKVSQVMTTNAQLPLLFVLSSKYFFLITPNSYDSIYFVIFFLNLYFIQFYRFMVLWSIIMKCGIIK